MDDAQATAGLPVEAILDELLHSLRMKGTAVLQAPPGAGKTTLVPLALLRSGWCKQRIIVIQPRRIAAFAAAERMAGLLNEVAGDQVGYRTRFDSRISSATVVEVVTDGLFLRMIQDDPELEGVSAVLFDEFHERTVAMDLALAFALEARQSLREADEPLYLLIMSATLDGQALSDWLGAELTESAGRTFPVTAEYRPRPARVTIEAHAAASVQQILARETGDVLVFLPGFREINRVQRLLGQALPDGIDLHRLHAALSRDEQRAALAPAAAGRRKVVLSTNIAETSVTIPGVRIVIDSGLVRVSRHDEGRGTNLLQTERISAASAVQRQGRAGRTAPGIAIRLWSQTNQASLNDFDKPEILTTDLLPAALELACWGVSEISAGEPGIDLPSAPDQLRLQRARKMLVDLGALDTDGRITRTGRRIHALGLHPRLGRLLVDLQTDSAHSQLASAALACVVILSEGDPLRFDGEPGQCDIALRLDLWNREPLFGKRDRNVWRSVERAIGRLARQLRLSLDFRQAGINSSTGSTGLAALLTAAWPDRIAQRRSSGAGYRLADGRGLKLGDNDALAGSDWLLVLDMGGSAQEPTITLACQLDLDTIEQACRDKLKHSALTEWDDARKAVLAISRTQLGELILRQQNVQRPLPPSVAAQAVTTLIDELVDSAGCWLVWTEAAGRLRRRMQWLHERDPSAWPDTSDTALFASADAVMAWLGPDLEGVTSQAELQRADLGQALRRCLHWEQYQELETMAPERFRLASGLKLTIDYRLSSGEGQLGSAVISTRMQNLFGTSTHPCLADGTRLLVEPLSPAQRPVQLTSDLPGFWRGSYVEAAKELRGRYPKHYWPIDPANAEPNLNTGKRRPSS